MKILVTGMAGFIGHHVSTRLFNDGHEIVGIDNINNHYSRELKQLRLDQNPCIFHQIDITNENALERLFYKYKFDCVIHLAALPGVRESLEKSSQYVQSNIVGFEKIMYMCKIWDVKKVIFASSSSVYHSTDSDETNYPSSFYAATKKSNEVLAYSYSNLTNMDIVGLRIFSAYGPAGRPDMMYFNFAKSIKNNEPIYLYNNGKMFRDMTYIDDICECISRLVSIKRRFIFCEFFL